MDNQTFYKQFSIISLLSILAIAGSYFVPVLTVHTAIAWTYLLFFSVFVCIAFFLAKRAALSENKHDYTQVVIGLIGIKLVACVAIVISYVSITAPKDDYHMVYFLVFYLIYSIFEFGMLSKIGYSK
jgi:ABC-type Fe3+-siderophore transport system permease subunit